MFVSLGAGLEKGLEKLEFQLALQSM